MEACVIGAGAMGRWFARTFRSWDWRVSVWDVEEEKSRQVADEIGAAVGLPLERADLFFLSVPISATPEVLHEIHPRVKAGALLVDIASVKAEVVRCMQELSEQRRDTELVSLHPLFGPGAPGLKGETVVAVPVRKGRIYDELRRRLVTDGAEVVEMEAGAHDEMMARVQALTHFLLLGYLGLCPRQALQTPLSRRMHQLAKAMLSVSPRTSFELQTLNPFAKELRGECLKRLEQLNRLLEERKWGDFERLVTEFTREFGPEIQRAYRRLYDEDRRAGA